MSRVIFHSASPRVFSVASPRVLFLFRRSQFGNKFFLILAGLEETVLLLTMEEDSFEPECSSLQLSDDERPAIIVSGVLVSFFVDVVFSFLVDGVELL